MGALLGLGISQPILDLVARHPGFISSYGLAGLDLVVFALAVAWLPAMGVMLPLAWVLSRRDVMGRWLAGILLVIGLLILGLGLASRGFGTLPIAASAAACLAVIGVALYQRFAEFRFLFSVLSIVLVAAPVVFLASDSVAWQWLPSQERQPPPPVANPQPVFILLFDELPGWLLTTPDLEIDEQRFPNLAALAAVSDYYPLAHSSAEGTLASVPSFLSGTHMREDAGAKGAECNILQQLTTSYDLNIHELVTDLAPKSAWSPRQGRDLLTIPRDLFWVYLHWLLPGSLHDRLPTIDTRWSGFGAEAALDLSAAAATQEVTEVTVPRFNRFLQSIGPSSDSGRGRPPFAFYHSEVPHTPWRLLPSGQAYSGMAPRFERGVYRTDPWFALEARARSELQCRAVDQLVRRFVERLESLGQFDSSWIIVTSDHGAIYESGAYVRSTLYEHLPIMLSVPLLIKRPAQRTPRRIERYVELVDVATTLSEELGFELPCPSDGMSLSEAEPKLYSDSVYVKVFGYDEGDLGEVEAKLRDQSATHRRILGIDPAGEEFHSEFSASSPYGLGPYGMLVGHEAPHDAPSLGYVLELEDTGYRSDFDPTAPQIPARILGRIHGLDPEQHLHLALALAGRIVATTRSRTLMSEEVFSAIADPALLRPGLFQAFAVGGSPSEPEFHQLELIDQESRARELVNSAGRVVLRQGGEHGFDALKESLNVQKQRQNGELSILATNMNPMLFFESEPFDATGLVIDIEITVPFSTELQVWYRTEGRQGFARGQIRTAPLDDGRNHVVVQIDSESPLDRRLRIDPGIGKGAYVVHSLTVHAADGSHSQGGGQPR